MDDPSSLRSQLLSAQQQVGQPIKELEDLIDLPPRFYQCWDWFWALSNTRTEAFDGSNPITYAEIFYFFSLLRFEPQEWEIALIKRFDVAYLNHKRMKSNKA